MYSDLAIIDASACVYTGMNSPRHHDRSYYGYPVGGLHYLFRYVSIALAKQYDIIIAFDARSFRKDLLNGYKAGRKHDKRVRSQLELAYKFLQEANIACYKYDGYEADDIIAWGTQQNINDYYDITIYGNGHDLLHNVQNKVFFHSISSNTSSINILNFEKGIEKGKDIPLNTISAYKVFCGCTSDRIPSLMLKCGLNGDEIYQKYLQFLRERKIPFDYKVITNPNLVAVFANISGLFTEEEKAEVYVRIKLVYPADCPDNICIKGSTKKDVDFANLRYALTLFNDYESLRCLKLDKMSLAQSDINYLRENAGLLLSGAYEVDRNVECEINNMDIFSDEDLFLRDI